MFWLSFIDGQSGKGKAMGKDKIKNCKKKRCKLVIGAKCIDSANYLRMEEQRLITDARLAGLTDEEIAKAFNEAIYSL